MTSAGAGVLLVFGWVRDPPLGAVGGRCGPIRVPYGTGVPYGFGPAAETAGVKTVASITKVTKNSNRIFFIFCSKAKFMFATV